LRKKYFTLADLFLCSILFAEYISSVKNIKTGYKWKPSAAFGQR
jgi:hypothetical protein